MCCSYIFRLNLPFFRHNPLPEFSAGEANTTSINFNSLFVPFTDKKSLRYSLMKVCSLLFYLLVCFSLFFFILVGFKSNEGEKHCFSVIIYTKTKTSLIIRTYSKPKRCSFFYWTPKGYLGTVFMLLFIKQWKWMMVAMDLKKEKRKAKQNKTS